MDKIIDEVQFEDGMIVIRVDGDQHKDDIHAVVEKTNDWAKKVRGEGKKVGVLIEMGPHGDLDFGARMESVRGLTQIDYDRLAFWAEESFNENTANFLIAAAGLNDKARFFHKRDEAVRWVNE